MYIKDFSVNIKTTKNDILKYIFTYMKQHLLTILGFFSELKIVWNLFVLLVGDYSFLW